MVCNSLRFSLNRPHQPPIVHPGGAIHPEKPQRVCACEERVAGYDVLEMVIHGRDILDQPSVPQPWMHENALQINQSDIGVGFRSLAQ